MDAWEGRGRSVGCGFGLFCLGRKGGMESGWIWRSGGGVCEFVEDEWELVRQMWGFPDVSLDGFALRSLRPFVTV